jgi:glycosyltransferase involved in cell wall biosynthesis
MSLGTPIVCFRSGALTDIVEHDRTGLICEEESAGCLADALARLLSDPEKRDYYSRNCIRRYQDHYSKESIQRQWWELIMPGRAGQEIDPKHAAV